MLIHRLHSLRSIQEIYADARRKDYTLCLFRSGDIIAPTEFFRGLGSTNPLRARGTGRLRGFVIS
jgi:hypothetical protein